MTAVAHPALDALGALVAENAELRAQNKRLLDILVQHDTIHRLNAGEHQPTPQEVVRLAAESRAYWTTESQRRQP